MAALEMSLLKVYIEHIAVRMGQGKKKQTHVDAPPGGGVSFSNLVISTFNHLTLNFKEGSRSLRLMDNAEGSKNRDDLSGVHKFEENHDQRMDCTEDAIQNSHHTRSFTDSRIQISPQSLGSPQYATVSLSSPGLMLQPQPQSVPQSAAAFIENVFHETRSRVRISWNHGGNQVAIVGSWDNWQSRELLQNTGEKFVVVKTLPVGIYHYHFIVDGWLVYAPDLPWFRNDSGNAYNILDLPGYVSELPESMFEFETPPSPPSSYDNQYFNEDDFCRPPPELPPQLQGTILNDPSSSVDGRPLPVTPRNTELNHLYLQRNVQDQFLALGSSQRIHEKYYTMFLFKPLSRTSSVGRGSISAAKKRFFSLSISIQLLFTLEIGSWSPVGPIPPLQLPLRWLLTS
ncbi:SNF1-related protein kinase regulatory subunit beta-2-like isoform X1 [Cucurbita moschata]|uniref:SNF1-related protein kinase regulatory subunit beta-2-like isoform X1 n=1 Tax=Cucurbita moschata TaxID=3662 RepID=A0A6J1ENS9_CUCMO|nr:SNF1-related protein kinase regulatory subunit beta-2-like isoform X1 [Cucurbita moschata]